MSKFEKKLDNLRQVKVTEHEPLFDGGVPTAGRTWIYMKVQQLWKVQMGEPYVAQGPAERDADEFMHFQGVFPVYLPCKWEWRDLESVTEEEAKKEIQ